MTQQQPAQDRGDCSNCGFERGEHSDSDGCPPGGTTYKAQERGVSWAGVPVKCSCGGDCRYVGHRDHDGGSCEVFRCMACEVSVHVELPD